MEDLKRPRFVENQGNEQNPSDNCTQEIVTSVWSRIFHFGKKNFLIGTQILHFRREIDLGAPLLKTLKVALRKPSNLYAHVPLIGARPHVVQYPNSLA